MELVGHTSNFFVEFPHEARTQFFKIATTIKFNAGDSLKVTGDDIYFIEKGIVSIINTDSEKEFVEIASLGPGTLVGIISLYTNIESPPMVWFINGQARHVTKAEFIELLEAHPELKKHCGTTLGLYLRNLFATANCLKCHAAEERLVTAILRAHDSCGGTFFLTQERIAKQLDISRTLVNAIAGRLSAQGLIRYSRGVITITDKETLVKLSCDCYRAPSKLTAII